jgi:TRAP-type C4-dicarboxylate transport system substrate-binding protein
MPGYYAFTVKRPIKKLDDFKGLTLRAAPLYTPIIKKLGAAPVTLSPVETISALQRGVIDGQVTATMGIHAMGYDEFTKYRIEPGFCQVDNLCLINLDVWNKIPQSLQDVIMDVAKNLEYMYTAHGVYANAADWDMCKQTGMQNYPMEQDEAKKFLALVYDTLWEGILKSSPEYGPRFKKLMTKK